MKKFHSVPAFFLALVFLLGALAPAALADEEFTVSATSAILMDADTGEILYEMAPDERRYPASITKVMTGLLTVEAIESGKLSKGNMISLQSDLYTGIGEGGSTQGLQAGEVMSVWDLLNCALIPSANEACNALASAVSGDIPTFVEQMNKRAAQLGMTNTHFVNTHGYHDDAHYTTARDVAVMCQEAMSHPMFREIVSSVSYTVPATNLHAERVLHDTNALISNAKVQGYLYQYAIGIKTGSTPEAGMCLASAAQKDHRTMIGVILGGKNWMKNGEVIPDNYFSESRRLLEHGFNDFSRKTVLDSIEPIETIAVSLCAQQDYVTVQPASSIEATLPNDLDPTLFERKVTVPEALEAPIQKGQVLGSLTVSYAGKDYGTVDLVAATQLEQSQWLVFRQKLQNLFDKLWVKLILLAVVLGVLFIALRNAIFGPPSRSRRNRRRRSNNVYSATYRGRR